MTGRVWSWPVGWGREGADDMMKSSALLRLFPLHVGGGGWWMACGKCVVSDE